MDLLFGAKDFRRFIASVIAQHQQVRGYQGKLAAAARCQPSYFSKMLAGSAKLNSDQAMGLALFWQLGERETEYFLLAVEFDRAQTTPLKNRLRTKMERLRQPSPDLAERFPNAQHLSAAAAERYYSSWQWVAIHLLTGIPGYRSVEAIAERLHLPAEHVQDILNKLRAMNLLDLLPGNGGWRIRDGHLHLPKSSALTVINHLNWRQKAMDDAAAQRTAGLHYTGVQTHSREDYYRIRNLLLEAIDRSRRIVAPSENEDLSCLCVDFFSLT